MKYPCLPVGCCFPASIPLYREDYNIHTTHFHFPQWIPRTVVSIIYRSIFEHAQHLSYSSRTWCYWQLLWLFSPPHGNMVILLSIMVLISIHTNQYFKCYELSSSGLRASINHNKKSIESLIKQNKINTHRTTHIFVGGPHVVRLVNYFRYPEYVNHAAVIFND